MGLTDLTVDNFRCIERAELRLRPGLNLIWGGNGSGKTSLLEAIFLLGRGRSFRTRNSEKLIRHGQSQLVVFGRRVTEDESAVVAEGSSGPASFGGAEIPNGPDAQSAVWAGSLSQALGVQVSRGGGTIARIAGSPASSLADLSRAFPVQVIEPGVHKLVEEGANRRRRWLDWGVFHVEPQFGDQWVRYSRALKQRNAALRAQPSLAAAWDSEVMRLGEQVAAARRSFIERLQPYWAETVQALSGLSPELTYFRGWAQDASLASALDASRGRDVAKHVTHVGPHRADVILKLDGKPAREVLSRGQQKLVAVAMTLAQLRLLVTLLDMRPTLLLDDPAAELDRAHLHRFIQQVADLNGQLVITALDPNSHPFGMPERMFHVEHGRVS